MTAVFDLDDTLLDTARFKRDLAVMSEEEVVARTSDYLLPEAEDILGRLRGEGWTLVLLTLGDRDWQSRKVAHAGLEPRFDRIIYTSEPKTSRVDELRAMRPPLVMINDNGEEIDALRACLPEAGMIAMRGSKPLPRDRTVPVCDSLEEVRRHISLFIE